MKTEIFKDYTEFCNRPDKTVNGVTREFLNNNPTALEERNNDACWNCSDCYDCSGCSRCSDCSGCSRCSGCSGCYDCSGCSGCSDCYDCYDCSGCSRCSRCYDCSGCYDCYDCSDMAPQKRSSEIPKIEGIHSKVFEACSQPDALNMGNWHTCETTHCRAGWVVHLTGDAGRALEKETSTLFAAMQIYRVSSEIKVPPTRFYDTNERAMADMKRCAEEEAATPTA